MAQKYTSKLMNKRVLVVGGTSGIGFCVAEAAIEHGATVIIASSRQSKIDSSVERILSTYPDAKGRILGHPCDLGDPETVEDNIKKLLEFSTKEGKLDHVVSTAGDAFKMATLSEVTMVDFQKFSQVRVAGSLLLAKHSQAYMNPTNNSSFTMTGGVNTHRPRPGWSVGAGGGGTLEGLTRGLAVDMKPIRVNCVVPGAVLTELWSGVFGTPEQVKEVEQQYAAKHLVGEIGRPEDVAEAYLYFMKDKFADGQNLLSEGGYLLM